MAYRFLVEDKVRPRGQGWKESHREARVGIMLHYDASGSDVGAVAWFSDPRAAGVGYHYLVLDDGRVLQFAPYRARVYHAGVCRPSAGFLEAGAFYKDANSALVGVCVAATDGDHAWPVQLLAVSQVCLEIFGREGWDTAETWRITGHSAEAWPRGRKIDPEGSNPLRPVLDPELVRFLVTNLHRAA